MFKIKIFNKKEYSFFETIKINCSMFCNRKILNARNINEVNCDMLYERGNSLFFSTGKYKGASP